MGGKNGRRDTILKRKKILGVVIISLFALALTGCGSKEDTTEHPACKECTLPNESEPDYYSWARDCYLDCEGVTASFFPSANAINVYIDSEAIKQNNFLREVCEPHITVYLPATNQTVEREWYFLTSLFSYYDNAQYNDPVKITVSNNLCCLPVTKTCQLKHR